MLGEALSRAEFTTRVRGDRCWAVYTEDGGIGSGKNSTRFRRVDGLLSLRARLGGTGGDGGRGSGSGAGGPDAVPVVELPDGRRLRADDPQAPAVLGGLLGRPLELRPETTVPHHDDSPVHVVTTAALRRLSALLGAPVDPVRFRANVVVDVPGEGFPEDSWPGRELRLGGDVVLRLTEPMPRCVMVSAAHGDLPRDPRVLRTLGQVHDVEFGLQAEVVRGGHVALGDAASLR
ncbi:hypothetical protein NUM3379_29800 [Kineococcus sp. NUM-3379]